LANRNIIYPLKPNPAKYPASAPSISTSSRGKGTIFVEGGASGAALQGPPGAPLGYLLLAENGNPILTQADNYIEIEHT
jgi:hypothetical protein